MTDRLAAAMSALVEALREELRAEAEVGPRTPDRLLSIPEAAAALSVGRTMIYSELAAGRLRSVKAGRRRLVPSSAITQYVQDRAA